MPVVEDDGTLSDDVAGGGGLHTDGGPLTVRDSTFDGNEATEEGGGLSLNNFGDVVLVDSTHPEQPRLRRRRPGEQRHRGHLRAGDWSRATAPRARAAASTTPRAATSASSTRRSGGTAAVIGGGLANAPDNHHHRARVALPEQLRPHRLHRGRRARRERRQGRRHHELRRRRLAVSRTRRSRGTRPATGRRRPLPRRRRRAPARARDDLAQLGARRAAAIGVVESDFVPADPAEDERGRDPEELDRRRQPRRAAAATGTSAPRAATSRPAAKNTCFLAVTAETAQSPIELGVRDRRGDPQLLAIADNGGPTLTHALQYGSLAIDSSAHAVLGRRPARDRAAAERTLRRGRLRVRRRAAADRQRAARDRVQLPARTGRSRTASRRWRSRSAAPTT